MAIHNVKRRSATDFIQSDPSSVLELDRRRNSAEPREVQIHNFLGIHSASDSEREVKGVRGRVIVLTLRIRTTGNLFLRGGKSSLANVLLRRNCARLQLSEGVAQS